MKTLKRFDFKHRDYFITVVTHNRRTLLLDDLTMFWESWDDLALTAWVVLPEHFHAILNTGDLRLSEILHRFKIRYSRRYRNANGPGRVWQNRFWDHMIRNENDFNRHIEYIHYNPVRHGMVRAPFDYPHSSIHEFAERGLYERELHANWRDLMTGDYGE